MEALVERIRAEGVHLGNGIIKVDSFLNHQIDPELTMAMGRAFARGFRDAGVADVTRIITAEVSGIGPALATGLALRRPVVYARKHRPLTMPDGFYLSQAPSATKGGHVQLMVSPQYLCAEDRVLLIDDFLASGKTINALAELVAQSGAELVGIGCVIEKVYAGGRQQLEKWEVPVISLARVDLLEDERIEIY